MTVTVELGAVAEPRGLVGGPFGSSLVSKDYVDDGVPVLRGGNLGGGKWIGGEFAYVTREKFERDLARNSATAGDLVFTQRGTLGQVAIVPPGLADEFVVSQSQMRLRVDPSRFDAHYVYYACTDPTFVRTLSDRAIRTGVPHINLGILAELSIPGRVLDEQRAIAEVLGALDDKIAANDRLIASADELLAARFESAAGDGVDVPLSSLARFVNGKAFTKNATGTGRVVVRIAELNAGIGGSTVYNDLEVADEHLARPGDLLFAWSGSLTVKRWFRPEAIVNQHIFKVLPSVTPMWVVKCALDRKLADFRAIAADKATTMGHIQRRHLDEPVRVPSMERIGEMDGLMTGLWDRALSAEIESLHLAELRDTLLPALMSGRLSVNQAAAAVDAGSGAVADTSTQDSFIRQGAQR